MRSRNASYQTIKQANKQVSAAANLFLWQPKERNSSDTLILGSGSNKSQPLSLFIACIQTRQGKVSSQTRKLGCGAELTSHAVAAVAAVALELAATAIATGAQESSQQNARRAPVGRRRRSSKLNFQISQSKQVTCRKRRFARQSVC